MLLSSLFRETPYFFVNKLKISLAIVFDKIIVSKASDRFAIIYAVAFTVSIAKINLPNKFLDIGCYSLV